MGHIRTGSSLSKRTMISLAGSALVVVIIGVAVLIDNPVSNASTPVDDGVHLVSEVNVSPEEAIQIASSERSGRVEDLDLEENGSEYIYQLKIDNEEIYVDAMTGDLLFVEHDNDEDFSSRRIAAPDRDPADQAQH